MSSQMAMSLQPWWTSNSSIGDCRLQKTINNQKMTSNILRFRNKNTYLLRFSHSSGWPTTFFWLRLWRGGLAREVLRSWLNFHSQKSSFRLYKFRILVTAKTNSKKRRPSRETELYKGTKFKLLEVYTKIVTIFLRNTKKDSNSWWRISKRESTLWKTHLSCRRLKGNTWRGSIKGC